MENPVFVKAVNDLKATYNEKLLDTSPKEVRVRELCYLMIRLTDELAGQLATYAETGNERKLKNEVKQVTKKHRKGVPQWA